MTNLRGTVRHLGTGMWSGSMEGDSGSGTAGQADSSLAQLQEFLPGFFL